MKDKLVAAVLALALLPAITRAQDSGRIDWPRYQDMAVELMQQYLRINTSNPPGNEIEAAKFFKKIFDQHGIENEIFEYKPGRANIIARIKGNGSKRPIILLSHTDVVTAEPSAWEVDPPARRSAGRVSQGTDRRDCRSVDQDREHQPLQTPEQLPYKHRALFPHREADQRELSLGSCNHKDAQRLY
jgi:hypothetical protein